MTTRELKRLIADEGKVLQNTKTGKVKKTKDGSSITIENGI